MKNKEFAVFILTHKRADNVITLKTLLEQNYTGSIYFIIDDKDPEIEKYIKNFGQERVKVFSKKEIGKTFDIMDNFDDNRAVVFARNACFNIAEELGIKYFMMLDDDYNCFSFKFDKNLRFRYKKISNLDEIFDLLLNFYKKNKTIKSIAMAQSGDFIGGDNGFNESITRLRKCMNSFLCSTERPFKFIGRINEDVNTYINNVKYSDIFLTIPFISLNQKQTQSNSGGLTDIYLNLGTYVKSFYSVMVSPSSVVVAPMKSKYSRLHRLVKGINTYPMIIKK